MSANVLCAHCGRAIIRPPGTKGRRRKVHAECESDYRAAQKRAKRQEALAAEAEDRGTTVDAIEEERRARQREGYEKRFVAPAERREIRDDLKEAGLVVRSAYGSQPKSVGRTVRRFRPRPVTFNPDGRRAGKLEKTSDQQRPNFIGDRELQRLINRAAAATGDTPADIATAFLALWESEETFLDNRQEALDYLRELADQPHDVLDQIVSVERGYDAARSGIFQSGLTAYEKTEDIRILQALSQIPGFALGAAFPAATVQVEGMIPSLETLEER